MDRSDARIASILEAVPRLFSLRGLPVLAGLGDQIEFDQDSRWYGLAVGGVVLGTILAASYYYTYDEPPAPNLCWYWTSSARVRGYWDYCVYPDD